MEAKELRIGNYVSLQKGEIWKDYQIDSGFDLYKADESYCADIKPILLTEEWLIKLGLKLDSVSKWKCGYNDIGRTDKLYTNNMFNFEHINTVDIEVIYNEDETELRRIGVRNTIAHHIKYVHQLQNIYFALTGEDLIYNKD